MYSISHLLVALGLSSQVLAVLETTLTRDGTGKSIYIPSMGQPFTSSVAAPQATPTIIYNCNQMPLICENVAAWVIAGGGGGDPGGNLKPRQLFWFDPDRTSKNTRRSQACGCFDHDKCTIAKVSGKRSGTAVTEIATSTLGAQLAPIKQTDVQTILAGSNPPAGQLRASINGPNPPGRFFKDGVGLTCDEFPAAVFIEGGDGAKTACAMQSWQVYQGDPAKSNGNPGKWPLAKGSGNRQEQDWQASVHVALRKLLGIGSTVKKTGYGTVYPFLFTTTTVATSTKAYVIGGSNSVITKRGLPATKVLNLEPHMTTIVVTGDDEIDGNNPYLQDRDIAESSQDLPAQVEVRETGRPHPRHIDATPAKSNDGIFQRANSECNIDFYKQGLEDIEVGDAGFDDDLDADESKPDCSGGTTVEQKDLQAINDDLDSRGDDGYNFDNCCNSNAGSCTQVDTSGQATLNLCGAQGCIGCAQLANYVEGIINTCSKNGISQGQQDINQIPGMMVQVGISEI